MEKKLRLAVIYGGRSGEHEVSLRSAASVLRHLDQERFEIVPIAIDKEGHWLINSTQMLENSGESLPIRPKSGDAPQGVLLPRPSQGKASLMRLEGSDASQKLDVVFPVMHGTFCEDGSIQGLFEMADVAYVGAGVLSSAVGMDKDVAKRLVRDAGLPIVPYVALKHESWKRGRAEAASRIAKELGYPVFVKPANLGSSVGVHKVADASKLEAALTDAFKYDTKVLVEKAVTAREIELSALENPEAGMPPLISVPGEVVPHHEFYSYEAKYLDEGGASLQIPAKLTPEQVKRAQAIAGQVFQALEIEGMARVDLFLDKKTGEFFFNEVNTLPGFTSISMYPKMWEASGIPYRELLTRLIELALARRDRKRALARDFHQD